MRGACSECGLDFDWAELLSDRVRTPNWCVEFARHWWLIPWRTAATVVVTLWPWRFWRLLQMHHEPRWGRIIAYFAMLLLTLYLLFAVMHAAFAAGVWITFQFGSTATPQSKPLTNWTLFPYTTDVTLIDTTLQSLIMPFSARSPGTITDSSGRTQPYPSPHSMLPSAIGAWQGITLAMPGGGWTWRYDQTWMWSTSPFSGWPPDSQFPADSLRALHASGFAALMQIIAAAAFALLPQSRRKCRVRWAHVFRIMLYGLVLCFLPAVAFLLSRQISTLSMKGLWLSPGWLMMACFLVMPIALVAWWSTASGRYLRMPHAWGIGAAVCVIGYLIAMACGYIFTLASMLV
jgi:hypothetical protein